MSEESDVYVSCIWYKLYILNNSEVFILIIMMWILSTVLILQYNYLNIVTFVCFLLSLVGILSKNNDL